MPNPLSDVTNDERLATALGEVFANSIPRLRSFAERFTDASGQSVWRYAKADTFANAVSNLVRWFRAKNQLDDLIVALSDRHSARASVRGFLTAWGGITPETWSDPLVQLIPRLCPLEEISGLTDTIRQRAGEWLPTAPEETRRPTTLCGLAVSVLSAGTHTPAHPPAHVRLLTFANAVARQARLCLTPTAPGELEDLNAEHVSRLEGWVAEQWTKAQTLGTARSRGRWLAGGVGAIVFGALVGGAGWGVCRADLRPRLDQAQTLASTLSRELEEVRDDRKQVKESLNTTAKSLEEQQQKATKFEWYNQELSRRPIGMTADEVKKVLDGKVDAFDRKKVQFVAYVTGEYVGTGNPVVEAHPGVVADNTQDKPLRIYLTGSAILGDRPRDPMRKRWAIFTGAFGTPAHGDRTMWAVNGADYILIDTKPK